MILVIYFLPLVNEGFWMESYARDFRVLKDLRHKLVRLQHHEQVYRTSLEKKIIPRGLRLKKVPSLGKTSTGFRNEWRNTLFEAK